MKLIERIKDHFYMRHDLDSQHETVQRIKANASFRGASLWILIFATFMASLGLNVNSTAVIIGAMLISPLMGPIIAMGLAIGTNDLDLLRRAFTHLAVATLLSILTACLFFLVSPFQEAGSELLARISPTLFDVLIAFMGGAAGIVALCIKDKGNVIPGVAIATALMPPLCTAGYGLAHANWKFFFGAFFLYFINSVFIALATFIGVKLLHFKQIEFLDKKKERMVYRIIWGIVILTMIPAGIMTYRILQKTYMNSQVNHFVRDHLNWEGTLVLASQVEDDNSITVHLMGPEIEQERIDSAARNLALYPSLKGYKLEVIQGTEYERMRILESKLHSATLMGQEHLLHLEKVQLENQELNSKLENYQKYEQLTLSLHRELRILFPQVKTLSLIPTLEAQADSTATRQYVTAQVFLDKEKMEPQELEKLRLWLKEKAQTDSLRLITDHAR